MVHLECPLILLDHLMLKYSSNSKSEIFFSISIHQTLVAAAGIKLAVSTTGKIEHYLLLRGEVPPYWVSHL